MNNLSNAEKTQMGLCRSSWGISMIAMMIVAVLEVFMMTYTLINPALYGGYIWRYRSFYLTLLTAAVIYLILNGYVKKDIEHRFRWMKTVNPLYAVLMYGWALIVTYSDVVAAGALDATVFMTFSLVVPLAFSMDPGVYTGIVAVADALMVALILKASGAIGAIINISIFFVFQIVLGITYLRMKKRLAERIVEEEENALRDVMTGCPNRRAYEKEIRRLLAESDLEGLVFIAIDINGLKETNDNYGHDRGDQLIIGTAQCIEQNLCQRGKIFRIGGDEFVALISAQPQELEGLLKGYENSTGIWSEKNGLPLSTSHGCVCCSEYPSKNIVEIARIADERMYQAKARYYQAKINDRRKYVLAD